MTEQRSSWLLRAAAVLTLVGLGFMLWSIFVPTALPVVLAMSLGQVIGILAFGMFGYVVLTDLRRQRAAARAALRRAAVTIHRAEELEARAAEGAAVAATTAAAAAATTAAALAVAAKGAEAGEEKAAASEASAQKEGK